MYHVYLDGQGFLIDPSVYAVKALPPTLPSHLPDPWAGASARTASTLERVQRQVRFGAGELGAGAQFVDQAQPDGWRTGSISVQATHDGGALRLGPLLLHAGAGAVFGSGGVRAFAVFRGALYAGQAAAPGEVWRTTDGATWSLAFTTGKPGVRCMAVYDDALYVGNAGDGAIQRWDGTALTTAWTNTDTSSIDAMAVGWLNGGPRLFLGNSGDGPGSTSHRAWVQVYDGVAAASIGVLDEPRIEAMALLDGRLFVCGSSPAAVHPTGALYVYDGLASTFRLEQAFVGGEGYAMSVAPLEGEALLAIGWSSGGRVRTWDPARRALADLLPSSAFGDAGAVTGLTVFDSALWSTWQEPITGVPGLRRYDVQGGAWSAHPSPAPAGNSPAGLAAFDRRLYLGLSGPVIGATALYQAAVSTSFAAEGQVLSAPFDGGLPDVSRTFREVILRHAPLPPGASLAVEARIDEAGAWQPLGGISTLGATETRLPFPSATQHGGSVALRVHLTRGAGALDGPELREIAVRFTLAPTARRAWSFPVLLEGDTARPMVRLDGTLEPRTAPQLAAALWTLRAQPGPLPFEDLDGTTHDVWFRDLEEVAQKPPSPWRLARVTLEEA